MLRKLVCCIDATWDSYYHYASNKTDNETDEEEACGFWWSVPAASAGILGGDQADHRPVLPIAYAHLKAYEARRAREAAVVKAA
jgi:hypothetical protein